MANKRRSFLNRMAEALSPPEPKEIHENPLVDSESFQKILNRQMRLDMIRDTAIRHREIPRTYRGTKVPLPNSDQHLFWKESVPPAKLEQIKNDETLLNYASIWTRPGGNLYYQLMYTDRLRSQYGLVEDPNSDDYDDYNHYFDWEAWKAEYNALKGS